MDQTTDRYLEFKQELQDVVAETVGEIKPELAEAFEWRTYVQRYPGTCLLASGALGWILGRRLGSQSPSVPAQLKIQRSESLTLPRMADKVVSSVLAEALPLIAAKMRRFSNVTTHPAKE
jgi:hypothetical protein